MCPSECLFNYYQFYSPQPLHYQNIKFIYETDNNTKLDNISQRLDALEEKIKVLEEKKNK